MLLLALSACAVAQPAPPPAPAPETPKKDAAPDKPAEKPKSLDDLLGIPKQSQTSDRPGDLPAPANDPAQAQRELERALKGESVGEMFEEAVILMRDAASRVDQRGDVGAATQRMQEEIIARLDAVIAKAQQNPDQSSSSSQSQSGQSQEQQQNPGQRGQQQQQQQQQAQGEPQDTTGAGSQQDSAQTRGWLDSAAPTWGKLPQRLRDALLQGAGDSFSSLYERMTEDYYRRLAEERPSP
jgi:hypothetical protein